MRAEITDLPREQERGAVTLLVATILVPLLFFLATLSLDLSHYARHEQQLQAALDSAARYGYRFLPYQERARHATERELVRRGVTGMVASVAASSRGITITASTEVPLTFARLFGVSAVSLPLRLVSAASGSAVNGLIVLDASAEVAPQLSSGSPWGDSSIWPEDPYLVARYPNLDARLVTQQCFNPRFSLLKHAAIALYDHLAAFSLNNIGAAVSTGREQEPLSLIRPPRKRAPLPALAPEDREASFLFTEGPLVGDLDCAIIAGESVRPTPYRFPDPHPALPSPLSEPAPTSGIVDPILRTLNPAYLDRLQTREVFWSQVAREETEGAFSQLLAQSVRTVLAAERREERGALVDRPRHAIVIVSASLPRQMKRTFPSPEIAIALERMLETELAPLFTGSSTLGEIAISYLLVREDGAGADQMAELAQTVTEAIARAGISAKQLSFRTMAVSSLDALERRALQYSALSNQIGLVDQ